jgi:hypothetical protein
MELSASYAIPLGDRAIWFTYFGYPGEPALGPTAFMHRASASENPSAASAEAITQLHEQRIKIVMLTGDSRTTANAVATNLGIDEVVAEVLPHQKAEIVKGFKPKAARLPWREME